MAARSPHFVLLHGTATTGAIWSDVRAALGPGEVRAPDRPSTGDLDAEIRTLAPAVAGGILGGVSGGATLGLAMLAAGVPMAAAVLHEPAVGSLVPGLLAPMAEAFETGGVAAFGRRLYGPSWRPAHASADPGMVRRDLAMFLGFEPGPPPAGAPPVLITVGELSPPVRHRAAAALGERFGLAVEVLPGCGHAAHLDAPERFARLLSRAAERFSRRS
ncbi:Alpha/beta hydrolase family protein [Frankia sp. EI5c]|uniref:alpha/beta fold hydrolase n=1 Tax=Frankia sp. EI5c TaxID=683316 RepID=UPI0007C3104C|nr:alpha/beta fold hydrolase [Frankia sp. EI5c]OAA25187.1 Alpha/beta hydrolase family protein [Frankia sp. EI5c]